MVIIQSFWYNNSTIHFHILQLIVAPNECALNCRAVGERFYATLEPEVVDGTPCTGPTIGNQKPVSTKAQTN